MIADLLCVDPEFKDLVLSPDPCFVLAECCCRGIRLTLLAGEVEDLHAK